MSGSLDRDFPHGYSRWQLNIAADDQCAAPGDCDATSRRGFAIINIDLVDANDNAPRFDAFAVTESVSEDAQVGGYKQQKASKSKEINTRTLQCEGRLLVPSFFDVGSEVTNCSKLPFRLQVSRS